MFGFNDIEILGVDPSLLNFGVVEAHIDSDTFEVSLGEMKLIQPPKMVEKTRKNADDLRRIRYLYEGFREASKSAKIVIAEIPIGSQSSRAMVSYAASISVLATCDVPLIQVTPAEVKIASVGNKTASKAEMIEWAMNKHPEAGWMMRKLKGEMVPKNSNEHLADAVAAIYAGIKTKQFEDLIKGSRSMFTV